MKPILFIDNPEAAASNVQGLDSSMIKDLQNGYIARLGLVKDLVPVKILNRRKTEVFTV